MHFSLRIALASLATHKLRAALAMLGVFLGALALTGVQHMSLAMVRKAEAEVEKLGPNLFMARAGQLRFRRAGVGVGAEPRTFTLRDARALATGMPAALNSAPFAARNMPVRRGDTKVLCQLVGTVPDYQQVRSFRPELGRFFTEQEAADAAKVCVLGRTVAERLFRRPEAALGQEVYFFRAALTVVGVMEAKGADIAGTDQDEQAFAPLATFMRRMANQDWISGVYLELAPGADPEAAKDTALAILRARHNIPPGGKDDFAVLTAKDTIQLQKQALDLVGVLGLISSSVSFAVGGLGILSIMILLVRARRLEIGVRRAVGARRSDIMLQFVFEAGLLSGAGGLAGVAASLALVSVVYALGGFPPTYNPMVITGTLAGSAALGLAAGLYPAWQASRLDILHVLRSQE
ncbi:MAG: ABC transporter permease [Thermodesulfobacteriota bacterium]